MIIDLHQIDRIYLVCGKTDLRKGIDGLITVVQNQFKLDPYCSNLFLFCGTRKDRFKGLLWENDGFLLLYKRYENGRLQWPSNQDAVRELSAKQLTGLLQGWSLEPTIHPYQLS
ncbi:IS66 family insertion sequence element accessory protein TnpB [Lactobacillus sp. ESL0791]|uniref:IS66 family insertion sequence element accessory protein TnpB n=1 Tax=Lactobacillus sp. ESL0791 TaxID=2983234 RepID=UPI0023F6A629|nr:IS66 family insertion sequence element accessory protein TnpB [Lactobacillus sp. ESL0791]MDF7639192.1 IS66 family insertion sequence element accessory protein TnpB [Lactobacillus sp. ESL0791]